MALKVLSFWTFNLLWACSLPEVIEQESTDCSVPPVWLCRVGGISSGSISGHLQDIGRSNVIFVRFIDWDTLTWRRQWRWRFGASQHHFFYLISEGRWGGGVWGGEIWTTRRSPSRWRRKQGDGATAKSRLKLYLPFALESSSAINSLQYKPGTKIEGHVLDSLRGRIKI